MMSSLVKRSPIRSEVEAIRHINVMHKMQKADADQDLKSTCDDITSDRGISPLELSKRVSEVEERAEDGFPRRGRNLFSRDLENHLLNQIKMNRESQDNLPDRIWISRLAKEYINKNNLDLKCSKGWLDKFMKRNKSLIEETSKHKDAVSPSKHTSGQ